MLEYCCFQFCFSYLGILNYIGVRFDFCQIDFVMDKLKDTWKNCSKCDEDPKIGINKTRALFTSGSGSIWNLKAGVYTEPAGFDRAQVETRSTFKTDLKTNEVRTGQVS